MQPIRIPKREARTAILVAMLITAAACRREASQPQRVVTTRQSAPATAVTRPPATRSDGLSLDSLPPAVREALTAQAPDFEAWTAENYALARRDSGGATLDSGSALVRAHFRSASVLDYALLGYDRRLHGLRIVGVLGGANGGFKVVRISDGPDRADSLAAQPDRYLAVDTTTTAGEVTLLVKPLAASPAFMPERFIWVAARGQFLLVEPD